MSALASERKSYPIYLLLDVSESMRAEQPYGRAPQEEFVDMMTDLIMSLSDTPSLACTAWISVIAFGDRAELLCPITSLSDPVRVGAPNGGGQTNYTEALRFLLERVERDRYTIQAHGARQGFRTRVAKPLVFFITDGAPYAGDRYQRPREWLPLRDRLVAAPVGARIAAIGLVGAHGPTLHAVATGGRDGARNAFIARPGAPGEYLARSVVRVIEQSIKVSVRTGDLLIDEPDGMRRVDG